MSKIQKFPLMFADGVKAHNIEELREHADVESILSYYKDGRLFRWLESLHYKDICTDLVSSEKKSIQNLMQILGINIDSEKIDDYLNKNPSLKISNTPEDNGAIQILTEELKDELQDKKISEKWKILSCETVKENIKNIRFINEEKEIDASFSVLNDEKFLNRVAIILSELQELAEINISALQQSLHNILQQKKKSTENLLVLRERDEWLGKEELLSRMKELNPEVNRNNKERSKAFGKIMIERDELLNNVVNNVVSISFVSEKPKEYIMWKEDMNSDVSWKEWVVKSDESDMDYKIYVKGFNNNSSKCGFVNFLKTKLELYIYSPHKILANEDSSYMFHDFPNLNEINFENFDMSTINKAEGMFSNCYSLAHVDLTGLKENIEIDRIKDMFKNCRSLRTVKCPCLKNKSLKEKNSVFNGFNLELINLL